MNTTTEITTHMDCSEPRNPVLTVTDPEGSTWTFGLRHDERWGTLVTILQDGAPAPGGWDADTIATREPGHPFWLDIGAGWIMPAPVVNEWIKWLDWLGFGLDNAEAQA